MPSLSPEAEAWGFAWGPINRAAQAGLSTQEVFQAVREEASRLGTETPPGMFRAVNELRSLAVSQRRGAQLFSGAADDQLFTRQHAPEDINARDLADQSIFPEFLVRFDLDTADEEGNVTTRTVTMRDTWAPDTTIGDVRQSVFDSGVGLANSYGTSFVGVSNLRPVSI